MKLEYYRGGPVGFGTTTQTGEWVNLTTDSPDIQTGGARGVWGGGGTPGNINTIDYITISTTGNAIDFGDFFENRRNYGACSSATRGVFGGGAPGGAPAERSNTVDYVTISSTGNAQDFGDLTQTRRGVTSCSSSTRGLFAGGSDDVSVSYNIIDYITIASNGVNAQDFGDLLATMAHPSACSSSTRGIFGGGSPGINVIQFVTISTLGNAADFGDLINSPSFPASCSNAVRGLFGGGDPGVNVIQYITIASLGNASDFGDLTTVKTRFGACSSATRGVFGGGYTAPAPANAASNIIDYVTIMSTGNAIDFGDLTVGRHQNAACSNGHGGLG